MTVSSTKTTFQLFTLSTKAPAVKLEYQETALEESDLAKYLGVTLDRRLSWKPHVENCAKKASKRTRILKRLTATKWGTNQDVLSMTYKSYIRPILDYGSEVTVTASSATTSKLDIVQNIALRVITGAPKSTPITAMEAQTRIEPLQVHRERTALKFWERSRRVNRQQWSNYKEATPRLKTQKTPIETYKELRTKYGIMPAEPAPLSNNHDFFSQLPTAQHHLKYHYVPKHASLPIELKNAALQTIAEEYPEEDWLHIYTDGSSIPGSGETGAAYYCRLFQDCLPVGAPLSNYDGEIAAVNAAAAELDKISPPRKTVFLVDSQTAIMNLSRNSETDCKRTMECRQRLQNLAEKGWQLKFQWIPSHVNISGNEKADELAKKGASLPQPSCPSSLRSSKTQINTAINKWEKQRLLQQSAGKKWVSLVTEGPIKHDLPRAVGVAAFRLKTGHDYLASHLHRIRVLPTPECQLCGHETMDAEHIQTCPALDHSIQGEEQIFREARLYWSARHQMAEQPRVGVG